MRAIVLTAGSGLRLAPHSRRTPKTLLPIAGEPAHARDAHQWPPRA